MYRLMKTLVNKNLDQQDHEDIQFKQHVPKSSVLDRTDGKTPYGYNTSDSGPSNNLNTI